MSVSVRCGRCGRKHANVPAKFAGKSIRCKECGESVAVPGGGGDVADEERESPALPPAPYARPSVRPAKRRRRSTPGWVWPASIAAALLLALGGGALLIDWPKLVASVNPDSEEKVDRGMIDLREEISDALARVQDPATAAAAARKIETDFTPRWLRLQERQSKLEAQLATLSPAEREERQRRREASLLEDAPRLVAAGERQNAEARRIHDLPEETRRPVEEALRKLSSESIALAAEDREGNRARRHQEAQDQLGATIERQQDEQRQREEEMRRRVAATAAAHTNGSASENRRQVEQQFGPGRTLSVTVRNLPVGDPPPMQTISRQLMPFTKPPATLKSKGSGSDLEIVFGPVDRPVQEVADAIAFGRVTQVDPVARSIAVEWTGDGS